MNISDYIAAQLREALGPVNKWYCSQHYGREVADPETLLRYYITHGGAAHFAQLHAPVSRVEGATPHAPREAMVLAEATAA